MLIVRSVTLDDVDGLWNLIERATYGLTTLQIDREQLIERVELSNFAFNRKTEKASGEPYVLVMEDTATGELVGLSCIFSKTGGYQPFYTYERVKESNSCEALNRSQEVESLHLKKIHDGPTEIGSLFLLPEYRGKGRGRLLSLSRFAFIANHPQRFDDTIIAEMRGVMSEDGQCPFWEAIGRHFFDMDFPQADSLSTINKQFIESLMPQHPIYVSLISEAARAVMGEVHENTRPALAMLEAEGFCKTEMVDIFDGGPVVRAARDDVDAVKRSTLREVLEVVKEVEGEIHIVCSTDPGFRATTAQVALQGNGITLTGLTSSLLQLRVGANVRVLSPYPATS